MPEKAQRPDQESMFHADLQPDKHEEHHDNSHAHKASAAQRARFATHAHPARGRIMGREVVDGDTLHWKLLVAAGFNQGVEDWFWASLDLGNGKRRELNAHTRDTTATMCVVDVKGIDAETLLAHPMLILEPPKKKL